MKGVLIGSDFLRLTDEIKFLEINTDTDLFTNDVDFLELAALFSYLEENNYTKLVLIYKRQHIMESVISVFQSMANTNGITLEFVVVPNNSITVPSITSEPNTFYLKCSYDVTAIIDDTYCRDKSEIIKLLFESNNESILPKTYVVNPNNNVTYNNFDEVSDNGIHPNVIVKKILPDFEKNVYPALYKIDTNEELADMKDTLNPNTLMQEYDFNEAALDENRICDVIRTWTILLEDVETMIYIGGHLVTNPIPLDLGEIEYTDNLLNNKWRYMYFSNPNTLASGVPGYYEVVKIDGENETIITMDDLQSGDVIKSIQLAGLDTNETVTFKQTWSSSLDITNLITYTTASVVRKVSQPYEGWLCNLNYELNAETGSSILTKTEILLVKDTENVVRFKSISEIEPTDSLVVSNNVTASILSVDEYWYSGSVVVINTEPDDVFLAGTDLNEINLNSIGSLIVHNRKNWW